MRPFVRGLSVRGLSTRCLIVGSFLIAAIGCGSGDGNKTSQPDSGGATVGKDAAALDSHASDTAPVAVDASGADLPVSGPDLGPAQDTGSTDAVLVLDAGAHDVGRAIEAGTVDAQAADKPVVTVDGAVADAGAVDQARADASQPDSATIVDVASASDTTSNSSCDYPKCLQDLQSACVPTGDCTMQFDLTTFSTNMCYANGVKASSAVNASLNAVVTWKNPSGTCYTVETASASTAGADLTWRNAGGTVAATAHEDFNARTITITCTGQSAVTLPLDCNTDGGTTSDAGTCAQGTCAF